MAADQKNCKLMSLPPELRNRIWGYIIPEDTNLVIIHDIEGGSAPETEYYWQRAPKLSESCNYEQFSTECLPSIANTCQQIRAETSAMYYGRNVFVFFLDERIARFEDWCMARSESIKHLRMVEIIDCFYTDAELDWIPTYHLEINKANDFVVELSTAFTSAHDLIGSCVEAPTPFHRRLQDLEAYAAKVCEMAASRLRAQASREALQRGLPCRSPAKDMWMSVRALCRSRSAASRVFHAEEYLAWEDGAETATDVLQ